MTNPSESWYTYIVLCADGSLYTGCTNNLEARLQKHNSGKGAKYTHAKRPVQLVYSETYPDRSEAQKREYQIKQLTRKQKQILITSQPQVV